ncbi:MAG: dUTP diphosphatase [Bdellovibrionales bacterium]
MPINIKDFASRVEGMANILGAYVESSLKDKGQLDQQFKSVAKGIEDYVAQAVAEKLQDTVKVTKSVKLKVKTLPHFKGELPEYQTTLAAGFDVCAQIDEAITLVPGHRELIPTGMCFEIPEGYEVQVRPRSGWAIKQGISLVNTPGTIDADYRGEVKVILINLGQEPVKIEPGQRIAQMVIAPLIQAEIVLAEDLSETERGEGGFGSTEKKAAAEDSAAEEVDSGDSVVAETKPSKDTSDSSHDSVVH